jgi:manganese transport protein
MGEFANPMWVKVLAYTVAFIIGGLNAWLLFQTFRGWLA